MTIKSLISLAGTARYHDENKQKYRAKSLAFVRVVAKAIGVEKGSYDVRFNAGGIAGSGDTVLHHERFYLHINDCGCHWRLCKGRKDYCGGYNRFPHLEQDAAGLAKGIAAVLSIQLATI